MNLNRSDLKRFIKILILALLVLMYLTLPQVLGTPIRNLIFILFFIALFFLPSK